MPYKNYQLDECARAVEKFLRENPGSACFQKWTCGSDGGAGCGERVTGNERNMLCEHGHHEERADGSPCGYTTDIRKAGCNWTAHIAIGGVADMKPEGSA